MRFVCQTFGQSLFLALLAFSASAACPGQVTSLDAAPQFVWPSPLPVSKLFGPALHPVLGITRLHAGVDFDGPMGAPITAAAAGKVAFTGARGTDGRAVVVDHGSGLWTLYAHLSAAHVKEGDCVTAGMEIARLGNTGVSAGPHLHFGIYKGDMPVHDSPVGGFADPLTLLPNRP